MPILRRIIRKIRKLRSSNNTAEPIPKPSPPIAEEAVTEDASAPQMQNIESSTAEIWERIEAGEELCLVDVRELYEIQTQGEIPNSIHIPLRELPTRWSELQDKDEIICYCVSGVRSYHAALLLREKGLYQASSLDGGIVEWKTLNAPIHRRKEE